jgi:hypothetical protein
VYANAATSRGSAQNIPMRFPSIPPGVDHTHRLSRPGIAEKAQAAASADRAQNAPALRKCVGPNSQHRAGIKTRAWVQNHSR